MINLLPPEIKQGYKYGRYNVVLRRWVIICLLALAGLGAIGTYGMVTIHQSKLDQQSQIASASAQIQKDNYTNVQTQVQDISNSFKLVVKVLGQEVLFSNLIQQIATILPSGANLTGLQISQTQNTINITAATPDYNVASQVEANLNDPSNKIFVKADLIGISCKSTPGSSETHPCTVTVNALLGPNNPFLFINSKAVH